MSTLNKSFLIGIALNIAYLVAEFVAGLATNSMGLLSDAGHNLSDVASLVLAMLAFKVSKIAANEKFTYGYKKSTVLVSLVNAVILLVAVGMIVAESVEKFLSPQPVDGQTIAWIAGIGVIINGLTAYLFLKEKEKDLNIKGAYLHLAADALVSLGVVISGVIIWFTGWYIIDPIIGLLVATVIVFSTWDLLKYSFRMALDGLPNNVDYQKVVNIFQQAPEVKEMHHLHIWAISTTENALTAHVVLTDFSHCQSIKDALKAQLAEQGIGHVTLEFETEDAHCETDCGDAIKN
ncbi:MAG: cation diffusion facilitator family transporter [Bacteroidales bacterium]|nr:cation diffusion facilitator family transporter [Bacteroidales bacterium]